MQSSHYVGFRTSTQPTLHGNPGFLDNRYAKPNIMARLISDFLRQNMLTSR